MRGFFSNWCGIFRMKEVTKMREFWSTEHGQLRKTILWMKSYFVISNWISLFLCREYKYRPLCIRGKQKERPYELFWKGFSLEISILWNMIRDRKWYSRFENSHGSIFLGFCRARQDYSKKPHEKRISVTKDKNFWRCYSKTPFSSYFLRQEFILTTSMWRLCRELLVGVV